MIQIILDGLQEDQDRPQIQDSTRYLSNTNAPGMPVNLTWFAPCRADVVQLGAEIRWSAARYAKFFR